MPALRSNWSRLEPALNPRSEESDDEIQLGELQRSTLNGDREEKTATGNCHNNTLLACKPKFFKYLIITLYSPFVCV